MPLTVGENVGPYRIIEQLGQGGMATVYKAYHAALDRYVAIKVMHPAFLEDKNFHARFQREARLVANLEHPNIVPVHDYAEHESRPYLVMKFIEGETLKARLEAGGLDPEETLRIVQAVGAALAYAHKQGVLHRDIKPSNVILARDGQIYLADFGLARIAQSGQSTLTSDMILGTPQYISPEQAMGSKDLDDGTDIYSFGVMIYELTVGRVPFSADTPYSVIHDHIYSPLPLPRDVNPAVHPEVERFLLKSLSKNRADRYPDVPAQVAAFKSAWTESMASGAGNIARPDTEAMPTVIVAPPPARDPPPEPDLSPVTEPTPAGGAETKISSSGVAAGAETRIGAPAAPVAATVLTAPPPGERAEEPAGEEVHLEKQGPRRWLAIIGGILLLLILGAVALAIARPALRRGASRQRPSTATLVTAPAAQAPATTSGATLTELEAARDAVAQNPDDPQAHMDLATAYFGAKLPRLALDELAKAAEVGANDADFLRAHAEDFRAHRGWLPAAIFYTTLAEAYGPVLPNEVREGLRETVYMAAGSQDALFPNYIPFDRLRPIEEITAQIAATRYAITRSNMPGHVPTFDELLASHPNLPEVRLLQGEVALRRGQPDEARAVLSELAADSGGPQWVRNQAEQLLRAIP
jgi:tRNA A-37 threonylcarbamoyl transferase component Bud32